MPSRLSNKAARLIDGKNFGFLATIMPDGSPQVSPVWIDREGDLVLLNTAMVRVKQRNVARDPRVAISIADQYNPYEKVAIRGRVISQTTEGADQHIDKLAKKYIGKDKYPWRAKGERRIIMSIEPTLVSD